MATETIDWLEYDNRDHVITWFLLEAMSKVGIDRFGNFDSSKLDICLTVNGVPVSFIDTMNFIQSQLDHIKNESIEEGRRQKMGEMSDRLFKLLNEGE